MCSSDADSGLVGVLGHEVAEDLVAVEELAVEGLLRLEGRGGVRVLDPDVALVVALDEDALDHAELVALGLHLLLELVEEGRRRSLHLEHVGHDQVGSGDCGDGRTLQVRVAGGSRALGQLVHQALLAASRVQILVVGAYFSLLGHIYQLHADLLVADLQTVHFLHGQASLLGVLVLDEGETFAHTGLRISVDVHVFDLSKGFEEVFKLGFLHL